MKKEKKDKRDKKAKRFDTAQIPVNDGKNEAISNQQSSSNPDYTKDYHEGKPLNPTSSKWAKQDYISIGALVVSLISAGLSFMAIMQTDKSLKMTQRMVKASEVSYLQVKDIRFSSDTVYYSLANLGQLPVKITQAILRVSASIFIPSNITENGLTNSYVIKEYPLERFAVLNRKEFPNNREYTTNTVLFYGEIEFTNVATEANGLYIFNITINPLTGSVEFTTNDCLQVIK